MTMPDTTKDWGALNAAASQARMAVLDEAEARGLEDGTEKWQRFVENEQGRVAEWKAAAVLWTKIWERGEPAAPDHPYLRRKGVEFPDGRLPFWWPRVWPGKLTVLRDGEPVEVDRYTDGDVVLVGHNDLLIAMKGIEKGNPIINVQRVPADAKRKKLFGRDARASRTFTSILGSKLGSVLYVCEGWATGWSIYHATGEAVAVSFMSTNLRPVAAEMRRRYPNVRIIIAADNDRWGRRDNKPYNPGLSYAQAAVKAVQGAELAVPDFSSLEDRPTDFNDLLLREGHEAVAHWLDPDNATKASTAAPVLVEETSPNGGPPEGHTDGPDPEPPGDDGAPAPRPEWEENAHFRCLGYDQGVYYYLPRGTGQITALTASQHDKKNLTRIAPLSWWESSFPARKGADWDVATDTLFRTSHRVGVFREERLRGRGCWPEETGDEVGVVLHLGDRLLPPGGRSFVDPERYRDDRQRIYERQPPLVGPSTDRRLDLEGARRVLSLFTDLLWHEEASGHLLAGWTVLAPICGALPWRPHVWLSGGSGAGKSVVLERLVAPLLGGMESYYEGGTTAAGIRQELRADARPVMYDEAEGGEQKTASRIQEIIEMIRSASSTSAGAHIAKGTSTGTAMSFQIRSMFCLAPARGRRPGWRGAGPSSPCRRAARRA